MTPIRWIEEDADPPHYWFFVAKTGTIYGEVVQRSRHFFTWSVEFMEGEKVIDTKTGERGDLETAKMAAENAAHTHASLYP